MLKRFVPLTSTESPTRNPYEVRTYLGDNCKQITEWNVELCPPSVRKCPPNNTIAKIMTIEDELLRLHEKTQRSRFQKPFKQFCSIGDDFLSCIVPQRTPQELKTHALMREYYLRAKRDLESHVHNAAYRQRSSKAIVLAAPRGMGSEEEEQTAEEEIGWEEEEERPVKPELASPSCSVDAIYAPTERFLELTTPTSGWFHNETEPPELDDTGINYSVYNPRLMQQQLDAQHLDRFDLIQGKTPLDLWTWNVGHQEKDSELQLDRKKAVVLDFDCDNVEIKLFKIPKDLNKTFRVVIVFGNGKIKLEEPPKKNRRHFNRPKEIAALYVAYVDRFKMSPDFWTAETMDAILSTSEKLVKRSTELNYKSTDTDFDILPQIMDRNAVVGIKLHFSGPIKSDPNLYKALSIYFSKNNAAILCSQNLYLLIWKRCNNSYYVFDPNGRNEACIRDFEGGKCSLISILYIEHLVHLIVRYSKTQYVGDFYLYEIFLINYGKVMIPPPNKPFPKPYKRLWSVINSTFAIIPAANTGLQQPVTGKEQNASMIISLLGLLYSDIERAQLWTPETLDELHKFGTTYFKHKSRRMKLDKKDQLNIMDLPEHIMMGVYKATLTKRPFLYTGHVADCYDFRDSQLTQVLQDLFNISQWEAGLLQIDNSVLAVWRDNELYYIFDPFRRSKVGQVLDPDDYRSRGVAVLQMHTNFESFTRNLYDKALVMRRGGKFFLHGINIKCIKPLLAAVDLPNPYPMLKLQYPEIISREPEPPADGAEIIPEKKVKQEAKKTISIETILDSERIPEFTDDDVVNGLLQEILCEIINELPEPLGMQRTRPYKQAQKVLLSSDRSYLYMLKHQVLHKQDEDNIYASKQSQPDAPAQPMTLEEELRIPSNYQLLPDGTWVIFGQSELPILQEDSMKVGGLLSGIVTVALSAKYKVSTWNSELIEYALEAVNSFGEDYIQYERALADLLNQSMPTLAIGKNSYDILINSVSHATETTSLRELLLESLICHNRLMVICQRFSCVIFKRYNFLYMFIGFGCNTVGYRKFGPGPACMLRFIELDALVRRIEFGCDPHGCEITNYVVAVLKVKDRTTENEQFRKMLPKDAKELYAEERNRIKAERKRRADKLRYLNDEITKENDRIERFLAAKKKREEERAAKPARKYDEGRKRARPSQGEAEVVESEGEEEEFVPEYEEELEEDIKKKHKRGTKLKKECIHDILPRPAVYGYRMRHKDHLYKIQGTVALLNRAEAPVDKIKPCFFASAVATLYVIMRPLNQWTSSRVDHVVNTGATIASRVSNMTTAFERIVKNITADDYKFDIWVKSYHPLGVEGHSITRQIMGALQGRKVLLLQLSNTTYAIYTDEYLHLFDPYGSMEKSKGKSSVSEEAEEESGKRHRAHGIKKYCERNTASWVLFADIESMLKYIDQRAANPNWRTAKEFTFHIVEIISFKKAAPEERILQLLTDMEFMPTCGQFENVVNNCAHGETMAWLDVDGCLPLWSRLNRRNAAGRYRGVPVTKFKKYDIEIDKRLWSVWGCLSPYAPVFPESSRGKQFLACNVIACLAAHLYRLTHWSPQLLDSIVISGDQYHRESLQNIKRNDYEFAIEDLGTECMLRDIRFAVHLEYVAMGKLYAQATRKRMNLADALMYFFSRFHYGILQCQKRSIAFGHSSEYGGGYFMFDCQSAEHPIFPKGQGAAYLLRTTHFQILVYCITVTLNVPYYNVPFTLHKVDMLREGAPIEPTGEEESKSRA